MLASVTVRKAVDYKDGCWGRKWYGPEISLLYNNLAARYQDRNNRKGEGAVADVPVPRITRPHPFSRLAP